MRKKTEKRHPTAGPPSATPEGEQRKNTARRRKVLIADEDQPLVERLKMALEERGYRVLAAVDGRQALDHARKGAPDYLVLDLLTPTVDGTHLYKHLKEDPRFRSLPLIVLAGTSPESAEWLKHVKPEAFIAKRGADAILEDLFSILQTFEKGSTPPTWTQQTGGLEMLEPRMIVTELLTHTPHLNAILHNLEEGVLLLDPSHRIVYVNPAGAALLKRPDRDLVGTPLSTIFHAEHDESFLEVLRSLATREGLATERLTCAYRENTFHITITNLLGKEGNAGQLLLIRDVSRSHRRLQELAALNELSSLLTSTLDLNEILRLIMDRTEEFLGVAASSLLLKDDETDELVVQIALGEYGTSVVGRRLKVGQGIAGWAFEHGSPLMVPDVREDRRFYQGVDYNTGFTTRSVICVPLKTREKVIGVMQVLKGPSDPPFTQDDMDLLSAIAAHAATAIYQARLFQETQTRADKLVALNELSTLFTSTLDHNELLQLIMQRIQNLLGVEASSLLLKDDEKDDLVIRIGVGDYGAEVVGRRLKVGQGIAGWVFEHGSPLMVPDVSKDPRFYEGVDSDTGFTTNSVLCVPLTTRDKVIGVIQLLNGQSDRPFTEDDVNLLSALAAHAATAIDQARLFEETQTRAEKLVALNELSSLLTSTLDLNDLLQLIMQRIQNLLGVEASSLLLKDDEKDELVFRVGVSEYGAEVVGRRLKVGQGIAGWVFEHASPLMVPDVRKDRRFYQGVDYDTGFKTRSVLCVPLSTRDKVIGVIQLLNGPSDRPFTEDDVNLLSALAAHAATAIENARLFEETQTRAEKVGALSEVSQAVSSSLDLENVFELVIRATSELLDAPVASLWTLEGDELVLREGRGIDSEVWDRHLHMVEQLAAWIVQQREPVVVREFAEDPRINEKQGSRPTGLHACAGFPLRIGNRCLGVLMLFRTSPEPFKREDVEFLSVFANQAAVAIDHARLYQELQSRSVNLQQVVRNRTAEIERKSHDLDRASRAKSEFLITMSHELKTSLGVVVAFSQLLEQQSPEFLNEKQAKYVTNIHGGARHVLALINNIVDLSAVDAGKLELHPEVVKVPELLLSVLAELRPQTDAKRIQFSVDVKKCPPKLMADRHRLKQIIYNLLSNAVHFTPEGGRISVEAKTPGDVVEFSVSDTGVGIKAKDLQRVFDRFAHLEEVKSTERRGTRLGLALAKHLVELHGGTIRAESQGPGQGSTFTFSLPLRSAKASQD